MFHQRYALDTEPIGGNVPFNTLHTVTAITAPAATSDIIQTQSTPSSGVSEVMIIAQRTVSRISTNIAVIDVTLARSAIVCKVESVCN